jgi:hypothetical protein
LHVGRRRAWGEQVPLKQFDIHFGRFWHVSSPTSGKEVHVAFSPRPDWREPLSAFSNVAVSQNWPDLTFLENLRDHLQPKLFLHSIQPNTQRSSAFPNRICRCLEKPQTLLTFFFTSRTSFYLTWCFFARVVGFISQSSRHGASISKLGLGPQHHWPLCPAIFRGLCPAGQGR